MSKARDNAIAADDVDAIELDYYRTDNILGTVSQTAGVPTGAIFESGSNANGEYVKYANGTLVCTRTATTVFDGTTAASPYIQWVPPAAFVSNAFFTNLSGGGAGSGTFT